MSGTLLKLPAVMGLNEAVALHGQLLSLRGTALTIDASAVERCGTQSIQVLASAVRTWGEDQCMLAFSQLSEAFQKTLQVIGVDLTQLSFKE